MKTIVTETALETNIWIAAIRTAAYFLGNGYTVPQPCPNLFDKRFRHHNNIRL